MSTVVFDCETTTRHNGNPFDPANRLCAVGVLASDYRDYNIEYDATPYRSAIDSICEVLNGASLVVGFNLKFDLQWIKNYNHDFNVRNVWDCQLAAYLLSGQTQIYPSLNECCTSAGLGSKLDVVKDEYWSKGIDTTDIPWNILSDYLRQDVLLTEKLYQYQREQFDRNPKLYRLFQLGCADLLWLLEGEQNGLKFNVKEALRLAEGVAEEIKEIDSKLLELWPHDFINWGSHDHLSVLLFGGSIYVTGRERYCRTLKSGEVKEYERNCWVPMEFPQLIEPDRRSESKDTIKISPEEFEALNTKRRAERKKPLVRCYSTEEGLLRNYKATGRAKETIELLLKRSELTKLISTYYRGIPEIIEEYGWPEETIHGSFMQVTTRTGRLSSKEPNLQNFAGLIKPLFYTRFD